jgi:NADPH:quinone reductase
MKIVQAHELGSIDHYAIVDAPVPEPGQGEVRVAVRACGMGYVDALVATGGYQVKPPLPFTPGQELGGVVDAVGAGVTGLAPGDRVMASGFGGGLADYTVVRADAVLPIPAAMTFTQAAVFRVNYVTALHGLRDRAAIRPGERLLVFGAAGGVGTAAVQVGRLLGAHVIACGSTEAKRAFAREQGADAVIDTEVEGWRDRLKALCGGKGPDVVFDPVSGPLFEPAFRSLAWGGRHLVVGFTGGPIPRLPINLPLMKGAALVGIDVRQYFLYEASQATAGLHELLGRVGSGELVPPVGRTFPFDRFAEAMAFALSGQAIGKPVVTRE